MIEREREVSNVYDMMGYRIIMCVMYALSATAGRLGGPGQVRSSFVVQDGHGSNVGEREVGCTISYILSHV